MADAGPVLFPFAPEIIQILTLKTIGRCSLDWDMAWWSMFPVTHVKTVSFFIIVIYAGAGTKPQITHFCGLVFGLLGKKAIFLILAQETFGNTCKWRVLLKERLGRTWYLISGPDILLRVGRPQFNHSPVYLIFSTKPHFNTGLESQKFSRFLLLNTSSW